jgi:hypothetical protein
MENIDTSKIVDEVIETINQQKRKEDWKKYELNTAFQNGLLTGVGATVIVFVILISIIGW